MFHAEILFVVTITLDIQWNVTDNQILPKWPQFLGRKLKACLDINDTSDLCWKVLLCTYSNIRGRRGLERKEKLLNILGIQ